jgi:hypothetical protein
MIEQFCLWYLQKLGYLITFPRKVSFLEASKFSPAYNEEQIEAELERVRKYLTQ